MLDNLFKGDVLPSVNLSFSFALRHQLKAHLQSRRLSARQLALQAGVPYTTIANWLEGRMPRNVDQLKRVANFFGISVDVLCYGIAAQEKMMPLVIPLQEGFSGLFELRLQKILNS